MTDPRRLSKSEPYFSPSGLWALATMGLLLLVAALLLASPPGWRIPWAWAWLALGICGMWLTIVWWLRNDLDMKTVLFGALFFRLLMVPFPPLLSGDFYRYIWDGMVQHAGDNPYRYLPSDARYEDLHGLVEYRGLNSPDYYSVYPPLSQAIFYIAASFREWGFQASYIVLKLLLLLLEGAGIWVLARMVPARDLMLYAWNPLIVLAVAGQGHTEMGMVGLLLLTFFFIRQRKPGMASLALAGAGWIKLYPFLLIPFLISRFGWRPIRPGILAAAGIAMLYFDGETLRHFAGSLKLYLSYFEFYSGPYFTLRGLGWILHPGDPRPLISLALALVFTGIGLATWWLHRRGRLTLETAAFIVFAAYIVCSRTVHPWYLAGLLCFLPFVSPIWRWPWLWLAAGAWGTYLFYVDGTYWPFVWIGWTGWAFAMAVAASTHPRVRKIWGPLIEYILRKRARTKAQVLQPALQTLERIKHPKRPRILDVGAAEGYLGEELLRKSGVDVELIDVRDMAPTTLPHHVYDGRRLPFANQRFDAAVIYFVLHHAEDPEQVLGELHRVTSHRVIIIESWARHQFLRRLLKWVDLWANSLRGGTLSDPIRYRSLAQWSLIAEARGYRVVVSRDLGGLFHVKLYLELEPLHE